MIKTLAGAALGALALAWLLTMKTRQARIIEIIPAAGRGGGR
ncbi:MAG: hypothetical protein V1816_18415 [Pseudomonadota bacterium]